MILTWADFKSIVNQRKLQTYFVETENFYFINATFNQTYFECNLKKYLSEPSQDQLDFEATLKLTANKPISDINAFASKKFGEKSLFKRLHGVQQSVVIGANIIDFEVPYNWAKITGLEVFESSACDKVNLSVHDTAAGTYSGTPNFKLNQFGFDLNVAKDMYKYESAFDADLYMGMIIRLEYTAKAAKEICVNFDLTEVK